MSWESFRCPKCGKKKLVSGRELKRGNFECAQCEFVFVVPGTNNSKLQENEDNGGKRRVSEMSSREERYHELLADICKHDPSEYDGVIELYNDFSERAKKLSAALGKKLAKANRDKAVMSVKNEMYRKDMLSWNPREEGYHSNGDLIARAIQDLDLSERQCRQIARKSLLERLQEEQGMNACIGTDFKSCGEKSCEWRADCRELDDLPDMGELKGTNQTLKKGRKRRTPHTKPPKSAEPTAPVRKVKPIEPAPEKQDPDYIEFARPEAMVQYIDMFLASRVAERHSKSDIQILLKKGSDRAIVVKLPKASGELGTHLKNAEEVFGAERVERKNLPKTGTWVSLNEFLERVHLRKQVTHPRNIECLLIRGQGISLKDMALVYGSFPRGQYDQCRFMFEKESEGKGNEESNVFLIFEGIRNATGINRWVRQLPSEATAFYPVGGSSQDIFFCQWLHAHPIAALPRLYDSANFRYILVPRSTPEKRGWVKITDQEAERGLVGSHQVFSVSVDREYTSPKVIKAKQDVSRISLPLRAVRTPDEGLARLESIARRIETYRQNLNIYNEKYERTTQAAQGRCRVALAFYEFRERGGLPSRLRQFLQRPYQTLDMYTYFSLRGTREGKEITRHLLFSRNPMPLGEAFSCCADEVYIQDARWQAWGLNVFLRRGVNFTPPLNDPIMAEQFRELFGSEDRVDSPEYCLVDAGSHPSRRLSEQSLRIVGIPETLPLSESVRFFNQKTMKRVLQASGKFELEELRNAAEDALRRDPEQPGDGDLDRALSGVSALPKPEQSAAETRGLEAYAELDELHRIVTRDLSRQVGQTEKQWRQTKDDNDRLVAEIQEAKKDIRQMEAVLKELAPTWEQFVDRALTLHLRLASEKIVLLAQLAGRVKEFEQNAEEVCKGNAEVIDAVREADSKVDAANVALDASDMAAREGMETIRVKTGEFLRRRQAAEKVIGDQVSQLQPKLKQENDRSIELQLKLSELEVALGKLRSKQKKNQERLLQIKEGECQIQALNKDNEKTDLEITERQREHSEQRSKAEALAKKLRGRIEKLQSTPGSSSMHALRLFDKSMQQVELVSEHRPGWMARQRAKQHFGEMLKLAPAGFFKDEDPDIL